MEEQSFIDDQAAEAMYDLLKQGKTLQQVTYLAMTKYMITSPNTLKARTVLFLEAFFRRYGTVVQFDVLKAEVDRANRQPGIDHMSPIALDAFLATIAVNAPVPPPGLQFPVHPTPARPVAGVAQPEAVLEWVCLYQLRGQFSWKSGLTPAFKAWLRDDRADLDLPIHSQISCWEFVFYALIKSAILPFTTVRNLYEQAATSGSGGEGAVLQFLQHAPIPGVQPGTKTLKAVSIEEIETGGPRFRAGDIIMIPLQEPFDPDKLDANVLQHVLIVHTEPAAALQSATETPIFHLWNGDRNSGGSGFADKETLGTFTSNASRGRGIKTIFYVPWLHWR